MEKITYIVKSGDTLNEIAALYKVDPRRIVELNAIQKPDLILIGQKLQIPNEKLPPSIAYIAAHPGPWKSEYLEMDYMRSVTPQVFGPVKYNATSIECGSKDLQPCCVTQIKIESGNSKREFKLEIPNPDLKRNNEYLLQVLSGDNDVNTVSVELIGGPCNNGNESRTGQGKILEGEGDGADLTPRVELTGPNTNIKALSPFKVNLKGPESKTHFDLSEFLKTLLVPDAKNAIKKYTGEVHSCGGGSEFGFSVEVFPNVTWKGEVAVGYEFGLSSEVVSYSNAATVGVNEPVIERTARVYTAADEGKFSVTGKVEGSYGAQKFEVALPTYERKGRASMGPGSKAFSGFKQFFERILPDLHRFLSNELVEITPKWPNVKLYGNMELMENVEDYNVCRKGKVGFSFLPLLGLEGKSDILDWLILAAGSFLGSPALGKYLVKIKTHAEKGVGTRAVGGSGKLAIEMTVTGTVEGGLEWEFLPQKDQCSGEVTGKISLTVEGVAEIEVRFFWVSARAGAKIKSATGFGGTLKTVMYGDDPGFSGFLFFSGLIITCVKYGSVGGSEVGIAQPSGTATAIGGTFNPKTARANNEQNFFDPVKVLSPGRFPDDNSNEETQTKIKDEGYV